MKEYKLDTIGRKYIALLICVMKADQKIKKEEKKMFLDLINQLELSKSTIRWINEMLSNRKKLNIDLILDKIAFGLDEIQLLNFIRDAYFMAMIDGEIDEREDKVIFNFMEKAGLPKNKHKRLKNWAIRQINNFEKGLHILES